MFERFESMLFIREVMENNGDYFIIDAVRDYLIACKNGEKENAEKRAESLRCIAKVYRYDFTLATLLDFYHYYITVIK